MPPGFVVRLTTLEQKDIVEVDPNNNSQDSTQILFYYDKKCDDPDLHRGWGQKPDGHVIRNVSLLSVRVLQTVVKVYYPAYSLAFSFHPEDSAMPRELSPGRWNCSGVQWTAFRHHYPCDLHSDCVGGEDEAGCPYTNLQVIALWLIIRCSAHYFHSYPCHLQHHHRQHYHRCLHHHTPLMRSLCCESSSVKHSPFSARS